MNKRVFFENQQVAFGNDGLVPAIVQDIDTRQVLMLAYMNPEAIQLSLDTGIVHFWSRSRNQLWKKGETSGNILNLVEIRADCDSDSLLVKVNPSGPACHTGEISCFFQKLEPINAE